MQRRTRRSKEALDARELVSSQIMNRLDECFNLIGEKPAKVSQRLHDVFVEDFRRELNEIQGPVARKIFVLAKASHLAHLQVASYIALIAAADTLGHPGVGVLLESCLADKLAFMERTKQCPRTNRGKSLPCLGRVDYPHQAGRALIHWKQGGETRVHARSLSYPSGTKQAGDTLRPDGSAVWGQLQPHRTSGVLS